MRTPSHRGKAPHPTTRRSVSHPERLRITHRDRPHRESPPASAIRPTQKCRVRNRGWRQIPFGMPLQATDGNGRLLLSHLWGILPAQFHPRVAWDDVLRKSDALYTKGTTSPTKAQLRPPIPGGAFASSCNHSLQALSGPPKNVAGRRSLFRPRQLPPPKRGTEKVSTK